MIRAIRIALFALIVTATGAMLFLAVDVHNVLINMNAGIKESRAVLAESSGKINHAKYGTLAMLNEDLLQARLSIDGVNKVILHQQRNLDQYDTLVTGMARNTSDLLVELRGSADAITGTAHSATAAIRTADTTLRDAQPLLDSLRATTDASTRSIDSLNMRIRDPQIDALIFHLSAMSNSADGIMADGRKDADYFTGKLTTPKTFRQKLTGKAGDLFDYGAFVARHF